MEVSEFTNETQQVFANPSGTLTLEQNAVPVRARKDGRWLPVSTALQRRSDGSVVPAAAIADIAFSGGGTSAPLSAGQIWRRAETA